jgi:PadR family transcriptional regulator, regulatory protein PadR
MKNFYTSSWKSSRPMGPQRDIAEAVLDPCKKTSPGVSYYRISIRAMKPNDLVQGTLGLLILRILALEPTHGWALAQRLKQMSDDVLQVGAGSLYPALHKLEQEGWVSAEWLISDTRRRVKFYSLTKAGQKQLESQTADWKRLSGAISALVLSARG